MPFREQFASASGRALKKLESPAWRNAFHFIARPSKLGWSEALSTLTLALFAPWIFFWPHVGVGGFYSDNWAGLLQMRGDLGSLPLAGAFECFSPSQVLDNPVGCASYRLAYSLAGENGHVWAALTLVLVGTAIWTFYLALRTARLPPFLAAAPPALVLVFDGADSSRMWYMVSALVGLTLFFLGLLIGARACSAATRLGGVSLALVTWLSLASSAASYQTIAPLVFGAPIYFYWASRRLLRSVAIGGVGLVAIAVIIFQRATGSGRVVGYNFGETLERIHQVVTGAAANWSSSFLGFSAPILACAAVLLVPACIAFILTSDGGRSMWLHATVLLVGGILISVLGVAAFIPAEEYYVPRMIGIDNRMNIASQFGYALLATALVAYVAVIVWRVSGLRWPAFILGGVILCLMGSQALERSLWNQEKWESSWRQQVVVLSTIDRLAPERKPREIFLTAGHALFSANWVPIFVQTWELDAALKIWRNNPTATGFPVDSFQCGAAGWTRKGERRGQGLPYAQVRLVDVRDGGRIYRPIDKAQCEKDLEEAGGNPLNAP